MSYDPYDPYNTTSQVPTTSSTRTPATTPRNLAAEDRPQGFADLSSMFGAASGGEKADRALRGQFMQNYDRLALEAQQERRAQESDAMHKLYTSGFILGGGAPSQPATFQLNGKEVTSPVYGGATGVSDAEKQAATSLQQQMLQRVQPSGSYSPTDPSKYAEPGMMENISKWGAIGTGALGAVDRLSGGRILSHIPGLNHVMGGGSHAAANVAAGAAGTAGAAGGAGLLSSSIPGSYASNLYASGGFGAPGATTGAAAGGAGGAGSLIFGKVLPGAAAAHGAYELAKNKSLSGDIMSGAESGAGIGTMIMPGVGTAIGGGIGALAGWGRHAFGGPDKVEQAGRAAGSDTFGQIGATATPAEQAQAQSSGWKNPSEALAYIVMSDKLRASGQDPALADQYMKQLYEAQKHGGNAVAQAGTPIQQMMSRG